MKFLTSIDLSQNEIQNAIMQPLAAPPANPKIGQIYFNSIDLTLYLWTGEKWIPVPTKLSQLENDSKFITAKDVPEGAVASTTTPKMNGTAAVGSETAFARGDRGKTAYDHSQSAHAPADAEKNVQSDWNETDGNSDAFIKNKPAIPKAVTKTVQTLSDAASKSFTVTGYILSVILIDSVTKEQVIGDVSFENATASANGKVTVTLAAAPSNPILVIITSIAL